MVFLRNNDNNSDNDDDNDSETLWNNNYEEKNIEQAEVKDLDFDNENDISKDNKKNLSISKDKDSSSEKDYIKNCTLNVMINKNKNKNNTSKKEKTSDKRDLNNKTISEESDETRIKEELNKNNKKIKNKNEEINSINSKNNNNIEELEYSPFNYILSSQGSMKNNYIQTINEFNLNKINYDKRNPNNFTINNNFITNKVINNINPQRIKNELSIAHFNFNFKRKNEISNAIQKQNNDINKINNLSIFKNSFEITAIKKEKNINLKNKKIVSNKNKINNNFTSNDSDSSFSSSSDKKNKNKSRELDKSFTYEIPLKKIKHSSSSSDSSSSQNISKNKPYKIQKNKRFKFNAEYFNLNKLTKGKFSNNLKFQNYIKNIIIEKLSDINHSKVELPRIKESIKAKVSNSALPLNKKKISKKFSAYLPLSNIRNENLKNSIHKMHRNNLMISLQNEKGNHENNSTKKKIYRKSNKSNNNDVFLKQVTRNIRDDSAVLNDPGKFYNGLFNGLMKRYTKANFKQFPK